MAGKVARRNFNERRPPCRHYVRGMIEDMSLAGLAIEERREKIYVQAVRRLAGHYRRSPDLLSEEETFFRGYLLDLRQLRKRYVGGKMIQTRQVPALPFSITIPLTVRGDCSGEKKDRLRRGRSGCLRRCREDSRSGNCSGVSATNGSQDVPRRHVCVWPAHQRGHHP